MDLLFSVAFGAFEFRIHSNSDLIVTVNNWTAMDLLFSVTYGMYVLGLVRTLRSGY